MFEENILKMINRILRKREAKELTELNLAFSLRKDLGFDSFDLAELTVLVEDEFAVDIFEDGGIDTVGEIMDKINLRK